MGIDATHYLMVGVDIGYDENNDDQYDELEDLTNDTNGDLFCVFDGMNGNYTIVGEVLTSTKDIYNDMGVISLTSNQLSDMFLSVKDKLYNRFGKEYEPKLLSFVHYA